MAKEKEEKAKTETDITETTEVETIEEATVEQTVEEPVVTEEAPQVSVEDVESSVQSDDSAINLQEGDFEKTVTVQPIKFASFEDLGQTQGETNKNLDILMDIRLQLTVELGRTELPIKKVLELTRGSIIELEKVAGEPVELYANGKLIAHGEVVVIEDNFGLRITSITEPDDRIKGVQ